MFLIAHPKGSGITGITRKTLSFTPLNCGTECEYWSKSPCLRVRLSFTRCQPHAEYGECVYYYPTNICEGSGILM